MKITYLGHAGFCVENENVIIIMDPWLSKFGAFDSAWFQFPSNHHLAPFVIDMLNTPAKTKYVYISHEHKDHFDHDFLSSIDTDDFTFIIGDFRRTVLKDLISKYNSNGLIACKDKEIVKIPGGFIQLFLDDTELNRDSAILVKLDNKLFLNYNDCKKLDEIHNIRTEHGNINVFACQYSGATWHPTCYEYEEREYEIISLKKSINKFETVAKAIEAAKPEIYLPSAGPPCFLDPILYEKNFEKVNIFPHSGKIINYLNKRLKIVKPVIPDIMPCDSIDVETGKFDFKAKDRLNNENFREYLESYSAEYKDYFDDRKNESPDFNIENITIELKHELQEKLDNLVLSDRIKAPLYFKLTNSDIMVRVDFVNKQTSFADNIPETDFYRITAPSWEVARVLKRIITWDDFSLTFRMKLNRRPDVYQKMIEAFLVLEKEDLNEFCKKMIEIESRRERITIEAGGTRYSVDRFCPHEGGDLQKAWIEENRFIVCPRHAYKYDLHNEGKCTHADISINAICLENE